MPRTSRPAAWLGAPGQLPEFAIGDAFGKRVAGAVERDNVHESDPVVEHQHLILDSTGVSDSQLAQHVLDQLAIALRGFFRRDVAHHCGSHHRYHLHQY
jgi:hypothetical protein